MPPSLPLFEIPSPFMTEPGRVLLLEPPSADADTLSAQLLDDRYTRPFVVDDGEHLTLYFTLRLIQSAMRTRSPNTLALRYTQQMMLFMVFMPRPQRIALIGLGGGSIVKFCRQHLPTAHFTAIELDPDVIALRDTFRVPPDDTHLQVIQTDGADYLANAEAGIDVLMVDAFNATGYAPTLGNTDFFEHAAEKLSARGMLVINLAGDTSLYGGLIGNALDVFDDRVIVLPIHEDGNHLLFAFNDRAFRPDWRRLRKLAVQWQDRCQLDLPSFVDQLERAGKLRLAQRALHHST
ncbi:spermidine synthase-like protein [Zoogloeaceae bacterium G21618-S1]|nr:spermidine synthase-like protein [Zoogloeaceae bacterium G21618-S1]